MAESVNYVSLAAKLRVTNGTVNYVVIRACVYTVGSGLVLLNGLACSVTESVNDLLSEESFAANGALLTLGKTGFGTSGSYCGDDLILVTESVNCDSLAAKLCVTNGTVNYVIVGTGVGAVGLNVVLNNGLACGVTESVNCDSLAVKLCVTNGTVNYVIVGTGVGAIGLNVVLNNNVACVVTESVNYDGLTAKLCLTDLTVNCVIVGAVLLTVCVNNVLNYCVALLVADSGNRDGLSAKLLATDGTENYVVIGAVVYTVSGNDILLNGLAFFVTESVNRYGLAVKLCVTNGTVNYALVGASVHTVGSNCVLLNCRACVMTKLVKSDGLAVELCATDSTVNYVIVGALAYTALSNVILNNNVACVVTVSGNNGLGSCLAVLATCAVGTADYAGLGTGVILMSYEAIGIVAKSGNYVLSSEDLVTNGALGSLGVADVGTIGLNRRDGDLGVTGSGNYGLLCDYLAAAFSCAVLTFGKTCFGTSRSYCRIDNLDVTKLVLGVHTLALTTVRALVDGITILFASGSDCLYLDRVIMHALGGVALCRRLACARCYTHSGNESYHEHQHES